MSFGGVDQLKDVTATFEPGRLYTVIGRTLAGKTTLSRVLDGLQRVDQGTLTRGGTDFLTTPVWRRDTAMVYQQFINYPHLNVFDNVAFPLRRAKLASDEVGRRATESLARVGLADFHAQALAGVRRIAAARRPGTRSGPRGRHPAAGRTVREPGLQAA